MVDDGIVDADADGAGVVEIGRSKTDQEGQGAVAYLSPPSMRAVNACSRASASAGENARERRSK